MVKIQNTNKVDEINEILFVTKSLYISPRWEITENVSFEIFLLRYFHQFLSYFKVDMSGNTVSPQASGLSTPIVNAVFNETFLVIFKHGVC